MSSSGRFAIIALLATLAISPTVSAQDYLDTLGRWKTLNRSTWSGLLSDFERPAAVYFTDPNRGFLKMRGGARPLWYRTSDGGRTWDTTYDSVAIPHRMLDAGYWVSPFGMVTSDTGRTWQRLTIDSGNAVAVLSAFDRNRLAVLYEHAAGRRLAVTTDGGATWLRLDVAGDVDGALDLLPSTPFGRLPRPDPTAVARYDWWTIPGWIDENRFVAIVDAQQQPYAITFDLTRRTIDTTKLPPMRSAPRASGASTLYYFTRERDSTYTWRPVGLHISVDAGRTWDSVATPRWLDDASFVMFTIDAGAASNARTTDRGRTWTPIVHSYHPTTGDANNVAIVHPIDIDHFVAVGPYSLFARTSDGGRSWSQNIAGGIPTAIAAHAGRVVVGREYGSLAVSADSGETWRELAATGEAPAFMTRVWHLIWPDTLSEPERVMGVAGFIEPDRSYRVHAIESDDAGQSWRRGTRLPTLERYLGHLDRAARTPIDRTYNVDYASWNIMSMQFLRNPGDERTTGFIAVQRSLLRSSDAGRTWTETCDSIAFAHVVMADTSRGVAASVITIATQTALYATSDGGRSWSWRRSIGAPAYFIVGLGMPRPGRFQAFAPHMNDFDHLYAFNSTDYGWTWSQTTIQRSRQAVIGELLWLDTADLHVFRGGAIITHSTDGGETFRTIHTQQAGFGADEIAFDGTYAYVASPGNLFGRWRVARRSGGAPTAAIDDRQSRLLVVESANAVRDVIRVRARLDRPGELAMRLVDMLGRDAADAPPQRFDAGDAELTLDVRSLPAGVYLLEVSTGGRRNVVRVYVGGAR